MGTIERRPYEDAPALTQDVLDQSSDNVTMQLEMVAEIDGPSGVIRVSDRAKYVGQFYYEPRVIFPAITRTIGQWLENTIEFSSIQLTINNADGFYNDILPGGANYDNWVGREVVIKTGLAESEPTYFKIFTGNVTEVGGFARDTSTFTLTARNRFEKVNVTIPNQVLLVEDFPDIEDEFVGLAAPVIYGDWENDLRPEAPEVPAFPVNGAAANVVAGIDAVRAVISSVPLKSVDTTSVVLFRGDEYFAIPGGDVSIVIGSSNQIIDIAQQGFNIDGSPWIYETGDQFYLKCVGIDLGAYDENIIWQARDMLIRFGGLVGGDFDTASWEYFRDKNAPSYSAIALMRSRVWIQEAISCIEQVASMLEQVRVELFPDRDDNFKLSSVHFEEIDPSPGYSIKNWDVIKGSFRPQTDEQNTFNRAKADYRFSPASGENSRSTGIYRNSTAITQMGREISKLLTFPNLIEEIDVENQIKEIIKLASATSEIIEVALTNRAILQDIGNDVKLEIDIGSINLANQGVVGRIREFSNDPQGGVIICKIWSWQMVTFPGYFGPPGTVAGSNAVITKET